MKKYIIGAIAGYIVAKVIETETFQKTWTFCKGKATEYAGEVRSKIESAVDPKPATPKSPEKVD